MRRIRGFSKFELTVVVAAVAILAATLWTNTLKDLESVERMEMEAQARAIANALQMRMVSLIAERREREIVQLESANPVQWLAAKPRNYLGELDQPPSNDSALGSWYFDGNRGELVYRVQRGKRFLPDTAGRRQVRFKVQLVADEASAGRSVVGAVLRPVEPYQWR